MNKRQYARVVNSLGDYELCTSSPYPAERRDPQKVGGRLVSSNPECCDEQLRRRYLRYKDLDGGAVYSPSDLLRPFRVVLRPVAGAPSCSVDDCFPDELLQQDAQYFNRLRLYSLAFNKRVVPMDFEPSDGEDLELYRRVQSDVSRSVRLCQRCDACMQTVNEFADAETQKIPETCDISVWAVLAEGGAVDERLRDVQMQISQYDYQQLRNGLLERQQRAEELQAIVSRRDCELEAAVQRLEALEQEKAVSEADKQEKTAEMAALRDDAQRVGAERDYLAEALQKTAQYLYESQKLAENEHTAAESLQNALLAAEAQTEAADAIYAAKYGVIIESKNRMIEERDAALERLEALLIRYSQQYGNPENDAARLALDNASLRKQLNAIRAQEYAEIRTTASAQPQHRSASPAYREDHEAACERLLAENSALRAVIDTYRSEYALLLQRLSAARLGCD